MAARTSILSREWRYKWTKIPKLEVIEWKFEVSTDENQLSVLEQTYEEFNERKTMTKRCKFFYAIFQVLLAHQGPIFEFALSMVGNDTCVEIIQLITHLSRSNTLKKLKLNLDGTHMALLSVNLTKLFAMHQLTDLYLGGCDIACQSTFDGYGSLTTLYLDEVAFTKKSLLHHLSNLPLLKSFSLDTDLSKVYGDDDSTYIELFDCLPVIEHLRISLLVIKIFADGVVVVPTELPFSLLHLKYLHLEHVCAIHDGLPFFFLLIRCSPNLEKLKIEMFPELSIGCLRSEVDSFILQTNSDIWLEHLVELEIESVLFCEPDLDLITLILAKSPVLKKVRIALDFQVSKDHELRILRFLLRSPRASPLSKIIVECRAY